MPAKTEKQRRFMGAELRRARAGKKTKTGMTEKQLKEFASETHAVRGHRWQIVAAAVVLVAGAAVSACSENAGETVNPTVAGNAGAADVLAIEARDFSFVPNHLEAKLGDPITVEFLNSGSAKHSLSFYNDAGHQEPVRAAEIEAVEGGQSADLTFESPAEAATLYFRCEVHPDRMRGEVSVGA